MGLFDVVCERVVYPLWARREGRDSARLRRELARRQFDDPDVVAARQQAALRRVLRFAAASVPYYCARFARLGLTVEDVDGPEAFRTFPILTKSDVRNHAAELCSDWSRSPETRKRTSGSTGVPLEVRLDARGLEWKRACTLRADEWSGWRRGQSVAKVWGNPEYRQHGVKGWLRNRLYDRAVHLDTLRMHPDEVRRFAALLHRTRPALLFGHAHSVFLLADAIRRGGWRAYQPRGIITTAMVLHPWQRRKIEAVFGCPVTNRYGCEEVSLIACECDVHNGLHVNADSVLVEVLRDGVPAPAGTPGKIVVTDLSNFAMPLIRYQVGDVGVLSSRRCPCGRGLPLLEAIEGREADYVVTATGHLISGISLTENFATLVTGIAQIQIVQETVRRFLFRIVADDGFDESSHRRLRELVTERFSKDAEYRCEFVDVIPQEPSGKYRFCISHVAPSALGREGTLAA